MEEVLFSWVHLSDIHFGHGDSMHRADQQNVLTSLQKDIQAVVANELGSANALLLTGDIAFSGGALTSSSGSNQEYAKALLWLNQLRAALGISRSNVLCVPGNHDVQRQASIRDVARLVNALRQSQESLDAALEDEGDRTKLRGRFANYLAFIAELNGSTTPGDGLWWSRTFEHALLRVRVVGLNTALLCLDDLDQGMLAMGNVQLTALLGAPATDGELVVAMSHHPFTGGWLADEKHVDHVVRNRAHVHLSGHVHEAHTVQMMTGGSGTFLRLTAGAGHGEATPVGVPPSHGYSIGAVVTNGDSLLLRVWPRRWVSSLNEFRVDVEGVRDGESFAEHALPRVRCGRPVACVAISAEKTVPEAVALGAIDLWDERPEDHIATLQSEIETAPSPQLLWTLGGLLARVGRLEEAAARLADGDRVATQPAPPSRLLYGALLAMRQNEHDAAFDALSIYICHRDLPARELAIAYDMIGTIERARSNVEAAVDMLRASLQAKRRVGDRFGAALTLGNLGRLFLHKGLPREAVEAFRENLQITRALNNYGKLGLVSNGLAEALIESGAFREAEEILNGLLRAKKSSTIDKAFAQILLGRLRLLNGDVAAARAHAHAGRGLFEEAAFVPGLALVEELDGYAALAARWMQTAVARFRTVDEAAPPTTDPLRFVYNLRRRASVAAHLGLRALALEYTHLAFETVRSRRLPMLGQLEADLSRYATDVSSSPPSEEDKARWLLYWRARLPRPLARALPDNLDDRMAVYLFLEAVTDHVSLALLSMTSPRPHAETILSRVSFGQRVGILRELVQLLVDKPGVAFAEASRLVQMLNAAVVERNQYVHQASTGGGKHDEFLSLAVEVGALFRLVLVNQDGHQELAGPIGTLKEGTLAFDVGGRVDAGRVLKIVEGRLATNHAALFGRDEWILETGQSVG